MARFSAETAEKLTRLRAAMMVHRLGVVVLGTRANVAWLSGGGDNHVVSQSEHGFGFLVVTLRTALLCATRIELQRLVDEQPLSGFTPRGFPWAQPVHAALAPLLRGRRCASDEPDATGLKPLPRGFMTALRSRMTAAEVERYRQLGKACSQVIEATALSLHQGATERAVEAELAQRLLVLGIQPDVLLVGFDDRIARFRHPTPTDQTLQRQAMLVVCGQRHGLIANVTRQVSLQRISRELQRRHHAVCTVEAALWSATRAGVPWGTALKAGLAAYRSAGFPDEWKLHHQGGPTGYAGREMLVTPAEKQTVEDGQAVAWNPSITGTKTEDTFILHGKERLVVTACSKHWPCLLYTSDAADE